MKDLENVINNKTHLKPEKNLKYIKTITKLVVNGEIKGKMINNKKTIFIF